MFKFAILGCENSHANKFLSFVIKEKLYEDMEAVGVWSDEPEAVQKLVDEFGVYAMKTPDELVGKIDALVVTARRGSDHYKLAKPYIESGIPMFIDKPITSDPAEAVEFMKVLKAGGVKVTGGSSLVHTERIQELKAAVEKDPALVFGGFLRAPVQYDSPYDGFYFYSMHLIQSMQEIFGYYPNSVKAFTKGKVYTVVVRYDSFDVVCEFVEGSYFYRAFASVGKSFPGGDIPLADSAFKAEFDCLHDLLVGGEMTQSYRDFIAPVFLCEAIKKSIDTGEEITVERPEEI